MPFEDATYWSIGPEDVCLFESVTSYLNKVQK